MRYRSISNGRTAPDHRYEYCLMPDDLVGAFIVTTDDEKMFHCSVESLGANHEPRWMLRDSNGIQYLGPPVSLEHTPDAVRGLVNEWWALAKLSSNLTERTE